MQMSILPATNPKIKSASSKTIVQQNGVNTMSNLNFDEINENLRFFKSSEACCNTSICKSLAEGKTVQYISKSNLKAGWLDFLASNQLTSFGPWYYKRGEYLWRVKPSTIKIKYRAYITENEKGFNVKHVSYELPVLNPDITENNINYFAENDQGFKHWITDWSETEIKKDDR